jgi:hypothetical protein
MGGLKGGKKGGVRGSGNRGRGERIEV